MNYNPASSGSHHAHGTQHPYQSSAQSYKYAQHAHHGNFTSQSTSHTAPPPPSLPHGTSTHNPRWRQPYTRADADVSIWDTSSADEPDHAATEPAQNQKTTRPRGASVWDFDSADEPYRTAAELAQKTAYARISAWWDARSADEPDRTADEPSQNQKTTRLRGPSYEAWEAQKERIRDAYVTRNMTLNKTVELMKKEHEFSPKYVSLPLGQSHREPT